MNLLESQLPELRVRIDTAPVQFFDQCDKIARAKDWRLVRVDTLRPSEGQRVDIHFGATKEDAPLITLVSRPPDTLDLRVYPFTAWASDPISFNEYLATGKALTSPLLREHRRAHGTRYRLRAANGRPGVEMSTVNCAKLRYAAEKFSYVLRYLATGAGDARVRLFGVMQILLPVNDETLPSPLDSYFNTLCVEVEQIPRRTRGSGTQESEYLATTNARAATLLEAVCDPAEAITTLGARCREDPRAAG